jgi:hypothetical protein
MSIGDDELRELARQYPEMAEGMESGVTYYFIPGLRLPDGCTPDHMDALLCPTGRDGYPSRLFLEQSVTCPTARNWNASNVRILERNWFAVSWMVKAPGLRLAQLLAAHLEAFR